MPLGDVWIRGTLAFLIIAAGLWALARAERSRSRAVIALIYTGTALLSSLYNIENVFFRLGWNPRTPFGCHPGQAGRPGLTPAAFLGS